MRQSSVYAPKAGESAVQHAERIANRGEENERHQAQAYQTTLAAAGICWESRLMISRQMQDQYKYLDANVRPLALELDAIASEYKAHYEKADNSRVKVYTGNEANGYQNIYDTRENALATLDEARREIAGEFKTADQGKWPIIHAVGGGITSALLKPSMGWVKGQLKSHPQTALKTIILKNGETLHNCLDDDTVYAAMMLPIIEHCRERMTEESQAESVTDYANTRKLHQSAVCWDRHDGNVNASDDCITTIDTTSKETRLDEDGREVEVPRVDMEWIKDPSELIEEDVQAIMKRDGYAKKTATTTPSFGATALKPFKFKGERIDLRKKIGKMMDQERTRSYVLNSGIILSDLKLGLTTLAVALSRQAHLGKDHGIKLNRIQLMEVKKQLQDIAEGQGPGARREATADRTAAAKKRREGAVESVAA